VEETFKMGVVTVKNSCGKDTENTNGCKKCVNKRLLNYLKIYNIANVDILGEST